MVNLHPNVLFISIGLVFVVVCESLFSVVSSRSRVVKIGLAMVVERLLYVGVRVGEKLKAVL